MVDFCYNCGVSLPYLERVIRSGQEKIATDQICYNCKKYASEEFYKEMQEHSSEKSGDLEYVIKNGIIVPSSADESKQKW